MSPTTLIKTTNRRSINTCPSVAIVRITLSKTPRTRSSVVQNQTKVYARGRRRRSSKSTSSRCLSRKVIWISYLIQQLRVISTSRAYLVARAWTLRLQFLSHHLISIACGRHLCQWKGIIRLSKWPNQWTACPRTLSMEKTWCKTSLTKYNLHRSRRTISLSWRWPRQHYLVHFRVTRLKVLG